MSFVLLRFSRFVSLSVYYIFSAWIQHILSVLRKNSFFFLSTSSILFTLFLFFWLLLIFQYSHDSFKVVRNFDAVPFGIVIHFSFCLSEATLSIFMVSPEILEEGFLTLMLITAILLNHNYNFFHHFLLNSNISLIPRYFLIMINTAASR